MTRSRADLLRLAEELWVDAWHHDQRTPDTLAPLHDVLVELGAPVENLERLLDLVAEQLSPKFRAAAEVMWKVCDWLALEGVNLIPF